MHGMLRKKIGRDMHREKAEIDMSGEDRYGSMVVVDSGNYTETEAETETESEQARERDSRRQ